MTPARQFVRGVAWLMAGNGAAFLVAFVAGIALARLLNPADFGVVALASGLAALFMTLASWGLDAAFVQSQDKAQERALAGTVLTLKTGIAAGVLILILLCIPLLRLFYDPVVVNVLLVLAIGRLLRTPFATFTTLLQKDFLMKQKAILRLTEEGTTYGVAIVAALAGYGLWSLVIGQLAGMASQSAGAWLLSPWRPIFAFDRTAARHLIHFGKSTWVSGIMEKALHDTDDVAVGSLGSTVSLGLYSKAYRVSEWFVSIAAAAVTDTALPAFARLQNERQALSRLFELVLAVTVRLAVPFFLVTGLLTSELVCWLYGEKWLGLVPLYRILIVYGFLMPVFNLCNHLLIACNAPQTVTRIRLAQGGFFLPGVFVAVWFGGATGAAIAVDLMMVFGTAWIMFCAARHVELRLCRLLLAPAVAATAAVLAFNLLTFLVAFTTTGMRILACIAILGTMYIVALFLCEGRWLVKNMKSGWNVLGHSESNERVAAP